MTYVKTYLPTLKTQVVNLKRDAKDLSRDLQRLDVRGKKLGSKGLFTWSGGPRSSGFGFFCFHALRDTKQSRTCRERGLWTILLKSAVYSLLK